MKTKITKAERLQIIGLLALAAQHNAALEEIKAATIELLAIEDDDKAQGVSHVSEADDWVGEGVYNGIGAATMLKRLGIKVAS